MTAAGLKSKRKSSEFDDLHELVGRAESLIFESLAEAALTDRTDLFPAATFKKLAETKLIEAVIPKANGGAGLGIEPGTTVYLLRLLKHLGCGNLVVGRIYEGHFNAWQLIKEYGTPEQIERLAGKARRENHLFGVWNTEAGDGVKILADRKGNFRLEGAKTFASGAGFVNRPIVTGQTENGGWQMFVAPLEKIHVQIDDSWWQPMGMQSSRSYRVDFSGAKISAGDLLGAPDDYYRQPFFGAGAIRFAAAQLGAAELLVDLTRNFLRELNRTNDVFQQMRLGEMAIHVESGNLRLEQAAKIFDDYLADRDEKNLDRILHYAGMMRTAIEQICQSVMLACERSIGSRGFLKSYHFERVFRDLKMYLRQAAPDATLTDIGKFVLASNAPIDRLWHSENDDD